VVTTQIDDLLAEVSRRAWQPGRVKAVVLVVAVGVIAAAA
jgi:hypothetical protein